MATFTSFEYVHNDFLDEFDVSSRDGAFEYTQIAQDRVIEQDFVDVHLSGDVVRGRKLKDLRLSSDRTLNKLSTKVQKTGLPEGSLYATHCELLNRLSKKILTQLQGTGVLPSNAQSIVFIDHHDHAPVGHPGDASQAPDLLAIYNNPDKKYLVKKSKSQYHEFPYTQVISIVENKTEKTIPQGRPQITLYLSQHMAARPDMPGLYGLTVNPKHYQILWADASGITASPQLQWSNLTPLASYIRSLYHPPARHHLFDPAISSPIITREAMPNNKKKVVTVVTWTIKHDGVEYVGCKLIFIGTIFGRRTTVFTFHRSDNDRFAVFKSYYKDTARRFDETRIINHIHADGVVPGVVRLLPDTDTEHEEGTDETRNTGETIETARPASEKVLHRVKKQVAMGSTGEEFSEAKSVKDLLMAVYDAVEVHRTLVNERHVLHRDISFHNVMMYPRHRETVRSSGKQIMKNPAKFIDDVLEVANDENDKSRSLLIDFDNSATLHEPESENKENKELAHRTGTPRYIARSVRAGEVLERDFATFTPMPKLQGDVLELYKKVYSAETYDKYQDQPGITHGGTVIDESEELEMPPFHHRPDHDVESMYWVLFKTLLLAYPDAPYAEPTPKFDSAWAAIRDHTISSVYDTRIPILSHGVHTIEQILHPRLSSLAPLLVSLGRQVKPEYAYLSPSPPADHLHEAFRRILLQHIVNMDDPIPLRPGWSRDDRSRRPIEGIIGGPVFVKRRAEDMTEEEATEAEKRHAKKMKTRPYGQLDGPSGQTRESCVTTDSRH
ncbi:hypothetical protein K474DRAFT_1773051 [Panus rudis PR-1116 ss-1]|nr:hypothetical protein K474DRAFT_1773051 [Panus rudis PR-1116 ss-1]